MWNYHDMMPHWGWSLLMGLFWLLILAGLIVGIMWLVREYGGREFAGGPAQGPPDRRESPREILDRRYAEGELSREEYEEMKRDLEE